MSGGLPGSGSGHGTGTGVASFYGVISTVVTAAAWSPVSLPGPKTEAFSLPLGSLGLNSFFLKKQKMEHFLLKITRVSQATGLPNSCGVCIWQSGSWGQTVAQIYITVKGIPHWVYTSPLILLSLCNDLILEAGIPY